MMSAVINPLVRSIAFNDDQVAIHSTLPEVLEQVDETFRHMLARDNTRPIARLEVGKEGEQYVLRGGREGRLTSHTLSGILYYLGTELILRLMEARSDLLWFHAGGAAFQGRAILVCGAAGRGKSTLVANLCFRGWTFLSDDVVPLDPNSGTVMPFPQTPMVRYEVGTEMPPGDLRHMKKWKAEIPPEGISREAVPLRGVIFPVYDRGASVRLEPCSPATAALLLLQNCLNFATHREAAVQHLCTLVQGLPIFQLFYNNGPQAAERVIKAWASAPIAEPHHVEAI